MQYMTVHECAVKWKMSDRTVRNYCLNARITGVKRVGKTFMIPNIAEKPPHKNTKTAHVDTLATILYKEQQQSYRYGIYEYLQITTAYSLYNKLASMTQIRRLYADYLFDNDCVQTEVEQAIQNHFRAIDYIIAKANTRTNVATVLHIYNILADGLAVMQCRRQEETVCDEIQTQL